MRNMFLTSFLLFLVISVQAQEALPYQKPPKILEDLLLASPTPTVSFDEKATVMLIMERSQYPDVEELAQPELRIAGLRINPRNFGPSRSNYITNFKLKNIATQKESQVTGLPANLKAGSPTWNPSYTKIAFSHSLNDRIDLYEIDVKTGVAKKVNKRALNLALGSYRYIDDNTLMYEVTLAPASSAPKTPAAPSGPVVQENLGKAAPSRTYQDLIKNPYDEALFAFYATTQPVMNKNGVETNFGKSGIFTTISASPDKKYFMVGEVQKPFSYLVPVNGFPSIMRITDATGKEVKQLAVLPSSETAPSGFDNVQDVPRGFSWRADKPATAIWAKPLDGGIFTNKVEFHDAVYTLDAPFTSTANTLAKTTMRYRGIAWGDDNLALLNEGVTRQQKVRVHKLNPATGATELLIDRSTNDRYNDPGSPVMTRNAFDRMVLKTVNNGAALMMEGEGASPKGDLPFLAIFDMNKKANEIIWRCEEPFYEAVSDVIDADKRIVITRKESQTDVPNYFLRDLTKGTATPLTNFSDPQPALRNLKKEKISYKRADGIDLTATVYLPEGFTPGKDKPLPILMWAYPREFKSAADAAQVRGSQYRFSGVSWGSPVFYATVGYCVMDATEFPIVGEGDSQPNDTFIEQLELNAKAALLKIHQLGYGDTSRASVGGHSYGAFMTANLLAHTRLFKAGLARSGAYNRTFTPFGFQAEERTFWQAPDVYMKMSPFAYADKIKDALLLIHGDADNNPGTFPINSERLYAAVKGHGGTVRFVSLPYESHGYAARQNVLHMLYEQYTWLETYVKGAKK
jgi:dipeptidyl aminopeptidase/acylaminoacyl peptidase